MFMVNIIMRLGSLAVPASLPILLAGCGSEPPRDTLAKADFAIQDASRSGAAQYEPELLTSARTKLNRANSAVDDDENVEARRLAQEAIAEAMLANAKAAAAKQGNEVAEMKRAIDALKEESSRQSLGQ